MIRTTLSVSCMQKQFEDAAKAGDLDAVRFFCEKPPLRKARLNKRKLDGTFGDVRSVRNQWPVDAGGFALMLAARHGHGHIVQYLCELPLERGVNPADFNNKAVLDAACHGHIGVVQYLCELPLERGVSLACIGNAAVIDAARHGHIAVVRYLWELAQSEPKRCIGRFGVAMKCAAGCGRLEVVQYLCEMAAVRPASLNLGIFGNKSLEQAVWNHRFATLEYLLTLPCVDPAVVLAMPRATELHKDAARETLARRGRWTTARAVWVGAVAAAVADGTTKC